METEAATEAPGEARVSYELQADNTRLRDLYGISVWSNLAFILYDLGSAHTYGGNPWLLAGVRVFASVCSLGAYAALRGAATPRRVEVFRWALALGLQFEMGLLGLMSGGPAGTYGAGAILIPTTLLACARSWRSNLALGVALPLIFPSMMAFGALVSHSAAAQLRDPRVLFRMVGESAIASLVVLVCVVSTHRYWRLRREHFAAKEIGRYQLRRLLGRGGMGEVWAAWHPTLRREVAVKLLNTEPGEKSRQRFWREVRATTELTHPNTIRVFDYGETDDGTLFYTMELLRGRTLAEIVADEGPLPVARALYLMRQAAAALAEAHGKSIVHRDVKPENLFACDLGGVGDVVKVLDFGIAKGQQLADVTMTARVVGSMTTISPEAAAGRPAVPASDVYSLGVTLFYVLTGAYPFEGAVSALIVAHLTQEAPDVRSVRAEVPADLASVVLRCLEKSPAARFPDAGALEAALAACAVQHPWTPAPASAATTQPARIDANAATMDAEA